MTAARFLASSIFALGFTLDASAADVVAAPLDSGAVDQMQQAGAFGRQRVVAGDVLLANDGFQVVVFAQPTPGDKGRVGRILFLSPTGGDEAYVFESGPINDWERGDLGRANQLALVRFQRQTKDWSAELVVQMPEKTSWLEVTTTVRNTGEGTLEIPMVDVVRGPSFAKLADDRKGMVAIGKADAATLAVTRTGGGVTAGQSSSGEWFLGLPSADKGGNPVAKLGKKLFRFGKSDVIAPVEADESWSSELKDRRNWHRIPAGQSRTIHRRLVFGSSGQSLRTTLAAAGRTAPPNLQFVPATKSAQAKAMLERSKSTARRSGNAQQSAPKEATPIPADGPVTVAKPMVDIPTSPKKAAPPKVKPVEDAPKIIADSINDIGSLPPPIK